MTSQRRQGRPRTKPAEQRRDDLLHAAEHLFLDQSFALTTVDQITRAAGVAKGTFYLYFTAKEDVRDALNERFAQRHLDFIKQAVADASDHPIEAWAEAYIAFQLDAPQLPYEKAPALLIEHLTELLATISEDPHTLALFLFGGVQALAADKKMAEISSFIVKLTDSQKMYPKSSPSPKRKESRQGSLF